MVKRISSEPLTRSTPVKAAAPAATPQVMPLRKKLVRMKGDGITTDKPRLPSEHAPNAGRTCLSTGKPPADATPPGAPKPMSLIELMHQNATRPVRAPRVPQPVASPAVAPPSGGGAAPVASRPAVDPKSTSLYQLIDNVPHWKGKPFNAANQRQIEEDPDFKAHERAALVAQARAQGNTVNEAALDFRQQAKDLEWRMVDKGVDLSQGKELDLAGITNALAEGVPMATIEAHYTALLAKLGPRFNSMAHGWYKLLDTQALKDGTWTDKVLENALKPVIAK